MFGFVKKESLDIAVAEIANLKRQLNDLHGKYKTAQELVLKLTEEVNKIKCSDSYVASLRFDELKLKTQELDREKKAIENELKVIRAFKVERAENEIDAEIEGIRREKMKAFEQDAKHLSKERDQIEASLQKKQILLAALEEKITAAANELDCAIDKVAVAEALDSVNFHAQEICGKNSKEINDRIDDLKEQQKVKIKSKTAWTAYKHYLLDNSLAEGKAQQKRLGNFLLTAFNAHVDNIIALAKRGNFQALHKKIELWFERINKIGSDHHIVIERDFLLLRLEELREYCKYHIQVEMEKEEERYINEMIREEAIVKREIEAFVKQKEEEETALSLEIARVTRRIQAQKEADSAKLEAVIDELKQRIAVLQQEKQRALSLAQLTRAGHIYIISNQGSFGPDVFKIGMTRRLDPMDRVRELGDASVPFFFDVHGIIHTEDAPTLERELHNLFHEKRVNKDNHRREFFRVSLEEIEEALCKMHGQTSLARLNQSTLVVGANEG